MAYTAAVITVSDKGYRGERVDTSGPNLVELLKDKGFHVVYTSIIPDAMYIGTTGSITVVGICSRIGTKASP